MPFSHRQCGARLVDDHMHFRVWAPKAKRVDLLIPAHAPRPMQPEPDGCFETTLPTGDYRYAFSLHGGPPRADPCSLHQPDGPQFFSATFNPAAFAWTDATWRGIGRKELVFYELHVGTFTRAGTFDAIIPRLHSLKELGITALELMPIGQFPAHATGAMTACSRMPPKIPMGCRRP